MLDTLPMDLGLYYGQHNSLSLGFIIGEHHGRRSGDGTPTSSAQQRKWSDRKNSISRSEKLKGRP